MCATAAIDSNLHTYLLQAMLPDYDPSTDTSGLAPHRKAIIRSYFYATQSFYVVPTVQEEYLKITDTDLKEAHRRIHNILLLDLCPAPVPVLVTKRKDCYLKLHNKERDCQILAEAEIARLDFLLTSDNDFYKRTHAHTKTIKLMTAPDFWDSFGIAKGSRPKIEPAPSNPLYGKDWWRW